MRIAGGIFTLILALAVFCVSARATQPEKVPGAWLDSLRANLWRMNTDSLGYSFNTFTIQHRLDKNGNIKSSDTVWTRMTFDGQGNRLVQELDDSGAVKSSRVQERQEESDETQVKDEESDGKRSVQISMNPFSTFKPERRGNFSFTLLAPDAEGHPRFSVATLNDNPGFVGEYTVDTTRWVPLHITGHPTEPPKHVKRLEMDMVFEPDSDGANLIRHATSQIEASFLLLKFYMRVEQEFSDYQLTE